MQDKTLVIAARFCGPPGYGNGGYVCGRVAAHIAGPASVRLKAPTPLSIPLRLETEPSAARLLQGSQVLAEAKAAPLDLSPPAPPAFAESERSSKDYAGFRRHSFPRCFVCGPERAAGDGLRIFPGPLAHASTVAAPWIPDKSLADESGRVRPEFLWSALDCTSAFPFMPIPEGKAVLLGELSARIDGSIAPEEKCIAVGWALGFEGRKRIGGSAVFAAGGRPVAVGRAIWIEVEAKAFGGA